MLNGKTVAVEDHVCVIGVHIDRSREQVGIQLGLQCIGGEFSSEGGAVFHDLIGFGSGPRSGRLVEIAGGPALQVNGVLPVSRDGENLYSLIFQRSEGKRSRCKLREIAVHIEVVQVHVVAGKIRRNIGACDGHGLVYHRNFGEITVHHGAGEPYRHKGAYHGAQSGKAARRDVVALLFVFHVLCAPLLGKARLFDIGFRLCRGFFLGGKAGGKFLILFGKGAGAFILCGAFFFLLLLFGAKGFGGLFLLRFRGLSFFLQRLFAVFLFFFYKGIDRAFCRFCDLSVVGYGKRGFVCGFRALRKQLFLGAFFGFFLRRGLLFRKLSLPFFR